MRLTSGFGLTAPQEALENDMSVYRKTAEQIDDTSVSLLAFTGSDDFSAVAFESNHIGQFV